MKQTHTQTSQGPHTTSAWRRRLVWFMQLSALVVAVLWLAEAKAHA